MRYRRLGRTGLQVSECTIGTSQLAAPGSDRAEARAMVAMALDQGINAFEIAADDREVIDLLGELLRQENATHRVHVFARVASRAPFELPSPHVPVQQAYPGAHIRAQTDSLLAGLGVERLALQQLHAWCPEWLGEGDWFETMTRLRREGKIAGCGVSLFDHDVDAALEVVASCAVDSVQVMYNVFDQGAASALLPRCIEHDVGVIARAPLYYGALARMRQPYPRGDWRAEYFYDEHWRETSQRVEMLASTAASFNRSVPDLALRFCLSHPAIATAATGMRTREQLKANLQALGDGPLNAEATLSLGAHKWLC
ncbi:aldo/keto reductase [Sphingomonas sp. JC676]|uniref:aldo/keto reductase n=1 Tax=Sphingomonas sp. JC676 TaxID=2768065 RepID=UPI001657BC95|nr:aldo/keto reductase [Sphingomonas sp. JC676]MBC9032415.1 aldo/keto reductase [Sphingomonas sp. JC676]